MKKQRLILSLGSNLNNPRENIEKALSLLKLKMSILKISSLYWTSPTDYLNQNYFYNCCLEAVTTLSPFDCLDFLQSIEKQMKSTKKIKKGPRIIDLDIIFFAKQLISHPNLTIPHKHFHQRLFVLIPLLEIKPNIINPKNNQKIKDYLNENFQGQVIKKLDTFNLEKTLA